MVIGYSGYYLCRSNLAVVLPLILTEFAARGIPADQTQIRLGGIASLGVLAYAIGKFIAGPLAGKLGGRRSFLGGMLGSVLCTIAFAVAGAFPLFTMAWIANRAVQSFGWAGMVKIASRWFSYSSYGTVMGIVSLSFLFGDAASRQFMSLLIQGGLGWRAVFFTTAGVLFAMFLASALLIQDAPGDAGLEEPPEAPRAASESAPLRYLLRSPSLWLACLISAGLTLVRETFNLWTPTFFTQAAGMTSAEAAARSALFPLAGGISVLLAGYVSDRLGQGARAFIIFIGLLLTAGALAVLGAGTSRPVVWTAVIAFLMLGPYSYLAGAIALDFGGKRGSATASGLIDGCGYLGGVLAGDTVARISVAYGWRGAFWSLAAVSLLLSAPAAAFWRRERRAFASVPESATAHR